MSEIVKLLNRDIKFSNEDLTLDMVRFISEYACIDGIENANILLNALLIIDNEIQEQEKKTGLDVGFSFPISVNKLSISFGKMNVKYSYFTPKGERQKCIIVGDWYFSNIANFASQFKEVFSDFIQDHFADDSEGEVTDHYKEFGVSEYSFM